jgi:hypothetical protein
MAELRVLKTKLSDLEDVYKKQKALLESGEDSMLFATIRKAIPKLVDVHRLKTTFAKCIRLNN